LKRKPTTIWQKQKKFHAVNKGDISYANTLNIVWGEGRCVQGFGGET